MHGSSRPTISFLKYVGSFSFWSFLPAFLEKGFIYILLLLYIHFASPKKHGFTCVFIFSLLKGGCANFPLSLSLDSFLFPDRSRFPSSYREIKSKMIIFQRGLGGGKAWRGEKKRKTKSKIQEIFSHLPNCELCLFRIIWLL